MAFFLAPRFAPAYSAQCSPWACAPRPQYSYRRVSRPSFPSFAPFLSQIDDLVNELDRESRREAHRQRQQRKRAFRARFEVQESNEGYRVDGEVPGFEQDHIEIEVTDDNTLKVTGNTDRRVEQPQQEAKAIETNATQAVTENDTMEGVTLNESEQKVAAPRAASPTHSETDSHKSYQATVEDDFEDLGAETSSTLSVASDAEDQPKEPKGKDKVVDEPAQQELRPQAQAQESQDSEEQFHGTFERTFRFPERIDGASVRASLKNGLLSIAVPKAKAPEVRRIVIQ